MDDTITCLVRGPASRYTSGYLWLFPAWFLILSGIAVFVDVLVSGHLLLWLGASEIGGLLVASSTAVCVLLTSRRLAFWADSRGILLGSRSVRKRLSMRRIFLPWSDVAQVCLVPRRSGILVEIVLNPTAQPAPLPSPGSHAALLLGALLMPFGVGRRRPAITIPRLEPARYRLTICEMSAGQLRDALYEVRPNTVPVRVFNSIAAMRLLAPRPPGLLRPAWPTGARSSARPGPVSTARPGPVSSAPPGPLSSAAPGPVRPSQDAQPPIAGP